MSRARRYLDFVVNTAAERGVACETLTESRDDICRTIIDVAQARACELIVMASHGRRGIAGLLMGSQPMRHRCAQYEGNMARVRDALEHGTGRARTIARQTMERVHDALDLDYLRKFR